MALYIGNIRYKPMVGDNRASFLVEEHVPLPYDTEVEYLQSSGTQYIDTGYAYADGYTFEIDFLGMTSNTTVFGARNSTKRTSVLYYSKTNGMTINMAAYTGSTTPFKLGNITSRVKVKMSVLQNNGTVWVDDTKVYDNISFSGEYISSVSQAVFATKYGDNDYRDITSSKVYGLKMWQGTTIIRDYIPVRVGQIGYMYDKVSKVLYGNVGTGDFTLGPDKT